MGEDPINQHELGVQFEILLAANFDAKALHHAERREGVVDVPIGDAPFAAAEQAHLHAALPGRNDALKNHRIHKFGVLNPEAFVGQIDDAGHLAPAVHAAPDQAHGEVWMEELPVPIGFKSGNHLLHQGWGVADNAVIPGFGEVLIREVEGGHQGTAAIHHEGFLVGHWEGLAGPGHIDAPALKQGEGLIVPTIATGGVGIEHHPHRHPPLMGPKQGLLDVFGLELELLDPEVLLGLINQGHHSLGAVLGHDQQLLVMVQDQISHPKGGGPGPSM